MSDTGMVNAYINNMVNAWMACITFSFAEHAIIYYM